MKKKSAFALIEMLIVLIIVLFISYLSYNKYFKKRPVLDEKTNQAFTEQGIDTSSYKTIVDSTRSKIGDINKLQTEKQNQIDSLDR